jgi:hypothetical protein
MMSGFQAAFHRHISADSREEQQGSSDLNGLGGLLNERSRGTTVVPEMPVVSTSNSSTTFGAITPYQPLWETCINARLEFLEK